LYNPKSFLEKLKLWASCLSEVTTAFREECFRLLDQSVQQNMNSTILAYLDVQCNSLFFSQSHSAFSEICNLAVLCFETNTFPKRCSVLKIHEMSLLNTEVSFDIIMSNAKEELQKLKAASESILTEKVLLTKKEHSITTDVDTPPQDMNVPDLLQDIRSIKDVNDVLYDRKSLTSISSGDITPTHGDVLHNSMETTILTNEKSAMCENYSLGEGETCQSCAIDKCRACFVLRYFPIMNLARVRALLSSTSKCRWRTWIAYVSTLRCKYLLSFLSFLKKNFCVKLHINSGYI